MVSIESVLPRTEAYELLTYSFRYYTEESAEVFTRWAVGQDWSLVLEAEGSNAKAAAYQSLVEGAIASSFKLITTTRKSTDPPWINAAIRKRVAQRRSIYRREGRSAAWKRLKRVVVCLVKRRRARYMDSQRDVLLKEDSERNFFKNIRSYKNKDKPAPFDVATILPGDDGCREGGGPRGPLQCDKLGVCSSGARRHSKCAGEIYRGSPSLPSCGQDPHFQETKVHGGWGFVPLFGDSSGGLLGGAIVFHL